MKGRVGEKGIVVKGECEMRRQRDIDRNSQEDGENYRWSGRDGGKERNTDGETKRETQMDRQRDGEIDLEKGGDREGDRNEGEVELQ